MGGVCFCCGGAGAVTERKIQKQILNLERKEKRIKKLLLLGPGSAGKTTIFKQVKSLWASDIDQVEANETLVIIRQNLVNGIIFLYQRAKILQNKDPKKYEIYQTDESNEETSEALNVVGTCAQDSFKDCPEYMPQIGHAIYHLWNLGPLRQLWEMRGPLKISFPENMDYFFDKVKEIMREDYVPTHEDLLKVRARTTGIVETKFEMNEHMFQVFDVGGQRSERKKWIHAFDNVTAVLFVVPLNHFNAVLFEDEKRNGLHESIELFREICDSKWFRNSEMIIFFNKDDLFRRALADGHTLHNCFSANEGWDGEEWNGEDFDPNIEDMMQREQQFERAHKSAFTFIQDRFLEINKDKSRAVFSHLTTATDQGNIEAVFWDVQNIVIRSNLQKGGLML